MKYLLIILFVTCQIYLMYSWRLQIYSSCVQCSKCYDLMIKCCVFIQVKWADTTIHTPRDSQQLIWQQQRPQPLPSNQDRYLIHRLMILKHIINWFVGDHKHILDSLTIKYILDSLACKYKYIYSWLLIIDHKLIFIHWLLIINISSFIDYWS